MKKRLFYGLASRMEANYVEGILIVCLWTYDSNFFKSKFIEETLQNHFCMIHVRMLPFHNNAPAISLSFLYL